MDLKKYEEYAVEYADHIHSLPKSIEEFKFLLKETFLNGIYFYVEGDDHSKRQKFSVSEKFNKMQDEENGILDASDPKYKEILSHDTMTIEEFKNFTDVLVKSIENGDFSIK